MADQSQNQTVPTPVSFDDISLERLRKLHWKFTIVQVGHKRFILRRIVFTDGAIFADLKPILPEYDLDVVFGVTVLSST